MALTNAIESFPDRYSSSAWERSPTSRAWVAFTGEIDERILQLFSDLPIPVDVRFGAAMTETEAEDTQREVIAEISAVEEVMRVAGDPHPVAGTISIRYELAAGVDPSEELLSVIQRAKAGYGDVQLDIATADDPIIVDPEVLRGGAAVYLCTAGFTIRLLDTTPYRNGLLSAAHCPNAAGTPQDSSYTTTFRGQHAGSYGEVQKHSSNDPNPKNRVITARTSTSVTTRAVTSYVYPTTGQAICNYGKTRTNSSCTTVRAVGKAFTADIDGTDIYISRMTQSNGSFTNGGDSGGPWYTSNSAVGIHFGKFDGYSTFSSVGHAQSILGVAVRTQP